MQSHKSKIYMLTRSGLCAAILCIVSPFVIPFGAIPFSLAIMAVMLVSNIFSIKESVIAVLLFILLGAIGIPVFSGFQSGFGVLTGPTGGFILSYIPVSAIVSLARHRKLWLRLIVGFGALTLCYLIGTAHFMVVTGHHGFVSALTVCVAPFALADIIKVILSAYVGGKINQKLEI